MEKKIINIKIGYGMKWTNEENANGVNKFTPHHQDKAMSQILFQTKLGLFLVMMMRKTRTINTEANYKLFKNWLMDTKYNNGLFLYKKYLDKKEGK